jgi:hypothetical protein
MKVTEQSSTESALRHRCKAITDFDELLGGREHQRTGSDTPDMVGQTTARDEATSGSRRTHEFDGHSYYYG